MLNVILKYRNIQTEIHPSKQIDRRSTKYRKSDGHILDRQTYTHRSTILESNIYIESKNVVL